MAAKRARNRAHAPHRQPGASQQFVTNLTESSRGKLPVTLQAQQESSPGRQCGQETMIFGAF